MKNKLNSIVNALNKFVYANRDKKFELTTRPNWYVDEDTNACTETVRMLDIDFFTRLNAQSEYITTYSIKISGTLYKTSKCARSDNKALSIGVVSSTGNIVVIADYNRWDNPGDLRLVQSDSSIVLQDCTGTATGVNVLELKTIDA